MSLADLTADSVRFAIGEFRRIGRESFLKKYGFGKAVRFFVSEDDGVFDSKAVAGAAHGFLPGRPPLKANEFSGGEDTVAKRLRELGFEMVERDAQKSTASNPDWTRDELIVALNFYLQHRSNPPSKDSKEIADLSEKLNSLGKKLFPPEARAATFRNTNGVYMKLMNFRRFDPYYTKAGKKGLARGAKAEADVWAEFANNPSRCQEIAAAIISSIDDPEVPSAWSEPEIDDEVQEAAEGRLLTRVHLRRERDRRLVDAKRKQVLKRDRRLACEVCKFDFADRYGERGKGFIECHHTKPIATLAAGHKTHIDDLAVVCANCHRMIHRRKPWLSIAELRAIIDAK